MNGKRRSWDVCFVKALLCVVLGLATAMCGSDSEGEGGLTLLLVDDPIDHVTSLNVEIQSIEVHGNGPPRELPLNENVVAEPVNILELENGVFATLVDGNEEENRLPAGTYSNLKIHITEASITLTDDPKEDPTPATVPPDKFNVSGPFTISEGEITELYLVFHASNALHQTGEGEYTVHPSLKLEAKTVSGSITGSVSPPPGEGGFTNVRVFANRGDTDNEASTFAEPDGSFELLPLRQGTHTISAEWRTVVGTVETACKVHILHVPAEVVAEQVTNIETPITLDPGDPDC